MTSVELDHLFIFVSADGGAVSLLREFGLKEGARRAHAGQGTANVCYYFPNAYLELIWVHDQAEATGSATAPLGLWERSRYREVPASPFGFCFRPADGAARRPPFDSWPYRPAYLPPGMAIAMGANSVRREEPLLFFLPEARPPAAWPPERLPPLDHVPFRADLTSARVFRPGAPELSPEWRAMADGGLVSFEEAPEQRLELVFGGGAQGRSKRFEAGLPLTVRW